MKEKSGGSAVYSRTFFFQRIDLFPHGIFAHFYSLADSFVAGVASKSFAVFTKKQIGIHGNLAGA